MQNIAEKAILPTNKKRICVGCEKETAYKELVRKKKGIG